MNKKEAGLIILKKEMGEYYAELIEIEFGMSVCEFIEEYIRSDNEGYYCDI